MTSGGLPERTNGAASKAVVALRVTVGSNPTSSAITLDASEPRPHQAGARVVAGRRRSALAGVAGAAAAHVDHRTRRHQERRLLVRAWGSEGGSPCGSCPEVGGVSVSSGTRRRCRSRRLRGARVRERRDAGHAPRRGGVSAHARSRTTGSWSWRRSCGPQSAAESETWWSPSAMWMEDRARRAGQRIGGDVVGVAVGLAAVPQHLHSRQADRSVELQRVGRGPGRRS